jgi:hypothetical protein
LGKRPRVYRGGARVRGGCGRGSSAAGPGRVAPLRWLRRGVGSRARGAGCREKGARRLHCPVVERRQERAGVTQASAGAGKKGRPFRYPVARRATRRRRAGAGSGVAGVGRKGKADGWVPPVSCPERKGGGSSRGLRRWAGPACAREKEERRQMGSGRVGNGLVAR